MRGPHAGDPGPYLDLAGERLGGAAVAADDEFFAPKENLVKEAEPVWDADRYTDRGKWMDGWETRRRRTPGHDRCWLRLGVPGVVREVVVDTAFFRGNYPERCAVDGCALAGHPTVEELLGDAVEWVTVLPPSPLAGDSRNRFAVGCPYRLTHLRLAIFPDGGVARLRALGEVVCEELLELPPGTPVDLAASEHGGRVLAASDTFFGPAGKLLLPGPPRGMFDGWETRRRRGAGHDWALVRLAAAGEVDQVEVDTTWFKGNAPGSCSLTGTFAPAAEGDPGEEASWRPILAPTPLQPHQRHRFPAAPGAGPLTHVRFRIDPDGGVGRLRLVGRVAAEGRRELALRRFNALPPAAARAALGACCGAERWAAAMAAARPFASAEAVLQAAAETWGGLAREDWHQAFAAHPRIGGAATGAGTSAAWSHAEQAGAAAAGEALRARLAAGNRAYEERFGHLFIVRAAGRSAEEMLAILERRLANEPASELAEAAAAQLEITRLRLARLLALAGAPLGAVASGGRPGSAP